MAKFRRLSLYVFVGVLMLALSLPGGGLAAPISSRDVAVSILAPQAASATVRLTVVNKTGATLAKLVLTGPKVYTFYNVPQGNSSYQVLKGKYTISYRACGANKSKKVSFLSNYKFSTVTCPTAKINFVNDTGGTIYLNLTGPASYRFVIPAGKMNLQVLKGTYQFSGTTVCGRNTGTIKASGRIRWTWWCR
jgi:hypothetical protein